MSDTDTLLKSRGLTAELDAHVIAIAFNSAGTHAGFALGDGTIRLATDSWASIEAHAGAILSLAAHPAAPGFLTGGDDGKLNAVTPDGTVTTIASYGGKWVDHIATFAGKTPLFACAVGKQLHLFNAATATLLRSLPHPSTVTGIAFDGKGKRVAASHYNGASLWFTASNSDTPRLLEWKGSHTGIAIHPNGDALVTSMQENALHGWTLPEGKHMRMAGYPAKTESLGFTRSGKYLATAGADAIVLWPFFGGGPMGKPPLELAATDGQIVRRIACHPQHEVVAAGFSNGAVIITDIAKERVIPVRGAGEGGITALTWNPSGSHLAFGTETGFAAVVDFSER